MLWRFGVNPLMVVQLLGHANMETTARYADLAQDRLRDVAFLLSESNAVDFLVDCKTAKIRTSREVR